jgi:hypothetical protein
MRKISRTRFKQLTHVSMDKALLARLPWSVECSGQDVGGEKRARRPKTTPRPQHEKSSHVPFTGFVVSATSAPSRKSTSFTSGISPNCIQMHIDKNLPMHTRHGQTQSENYNVLEEKYSFWLETTCEFLHHGKECSFDPRGWVDRDHSYILDGPFCPGCNGGQCFPTNI